MSFNRVQRKLQLVCDGAVGRSARDDGDNLELRIGEAVPTCFRPRLADNSPLGAESAQLAADPPRIGERPETGVRVERRVELLECLVATIALDELPPSIFRGG